MLISVVVPIYNVEKYLNRCVDSILNQTFTDFELILVDDGSPDNCGKICDEYAEKDNRVRVIHKPNGGLSDARNAGIEWALKNSDSEWITFIDSDDWVDIQYLEFLLKAVVENNTLISVCKYYATDNVVKNDEKKIFKSERWDVEDFQEQKYYYSISSCVKLYKKDLFSDIRFPIGKLHEDAFTTWKVMLKVSEVSFLDLDLYFYFYNSESIMHAKWTPRRIDEIEAYEERIDFYEKNRMFKLKLRVEKAFLNILVSQINSIMSTNNIIDRKKYIKILRRKLRVNLRKYKKILSITIKDDPGIFECAYPKRMWLYWVVNAQINKIRKSAE